MKSVASSFLISLAFLIGCEGLLAQDSHWTIGGGVVNAQPKSSDLIFNIPGSGVEFNSETQILITAVYQFTDHLGLEVLASPPFRLSLSAGGAVAEHETLIKLKSLTPVVLLRYEFGTAQTALLPYLGVGLSYSIFYDETPTDSFFQLAGTEFSVDYQNSLSPILTAGLRYRLNALWSLNASISYLKPDPDIRLNIAGSTTEEQGNLSAFVIAATVGVSF